MPRLTFPYALDRLTIYHFLMGGEFRPVGDGEDGMGSIFASEDRALRYEGDALLTFDTGNSLVLHMNAISVPQAIRLANYVLALMDVPKEDYIQRNESADDSLAPGVEWVYRGEIVRTNDPLVLVGPMVIQAWRISQPRHT
jgi:hypothetical protein